MEKNEAFVTLRLPKSINVKLKKEADENYESKGLRIRKILIAHFSKK